MTLLRGKTGTLRTFTITPSNAQESLLGTPLTLPTTEPATGQFTFTVKQSDLPIITPSVPFDTLGVIVCSGMNGTTSATISYRILVNGSSVYQGSNGSQTANQYWNHTHWRTPGLKVGDTIEVRYWSSATDTKFDFCALKICPTHIMMSKTGVILKDLTFDNAQVQPTFTSITASYYNQTYYYISPFTTSGGTQNDYSQSTQNKYIFLAIALNFQYGIWRLANSDRSANNTSTKSDPTNRQVQPAIYPLSVSFREIQVNEW